MKIAILTSIPNEYLWADGLKKALELLKEDYKLDIYLNHQRPVNPDKYDMVIGWGGFLSQEAEYVASLEGVKKGLFWGASHGFDHPLAHAYDVLFVEDEHAVKEFRRRGVEATLAFGTDTDLFKPMQQDRVFKAISVGAYAKWKRKELFAEAVMDFNSISVGCMQKVETEQYKVCFDSGVFTLPNVLQKNMPYFYAGSSCVVITGWAGGQRTVLEALAMNIPVIVPSDAPHLFDYGKVTIVEPTVEAFKEAVIDSEVIDTRENLLNRWTARHYADAISSGIKCVK